MSTEKIVQRGVNDGCPHTKKVCEKPLYASAPYCMHCGWHKRFHVNPHHHHDLDIDTDADTAADIVEAGAAVAEVVSDLFSDSGDDSGSNNDDDFGGGGGDFGGGGGSSDW